MKLSPKKSNKSRGKKATDLPDHLYRGFGGFIFSKATKQRVYDYEPENTTTVRSNSSSSLDRPRRRCASGSTKKTAPSGSKKRPPLASVDNGTDDNGTLGDAAASKRQKRAVSLVTLMTDIATELLLHSTPLILAGCLVRIVRAVFGGNPDQIQRTMNLVNVDLQTTEAPVACAAAVDENVPPGVAAVTPAKKSRKKRNPPPVNVKDDIFNYDKDDPTQCLNLKDNGAKNLQRAMDSFKNAWNMQGVWNIKPS